MKNENILGIKIYSNADELNGQRPKAAQVTVDGRRLWFSGAAFVIIAQANAVKAKVGGARRVRIRYFV